MTEAGAAAPGGGDGGGSARRRGGEVQCGGSWGGPLLEGFGLYCPDSSAMTTTTTYRARKDGGQPMRWWALGVVRGFGAAAPVGRLALRRAIGRLSVWQIWAPAFSLVGSSGAQSVFSLVVWWSKFRRLVASVTLVEVWAQAEVMCGIPGESSLPDPSWS